MATSTQTTRPANPMATVLGHRDFRLLWLGQTTSLVGDQFYLIALPWLVLKLTGDPLAVGAVLALAGVPRAIFMLVGGAVTDRFSPRAIMLISDAARLALVAGLAALVLAGAAQMWLVYLFSAAFGVISGLFEPASATMVPSVVPEAELEAGNAIFQGSGELAGFIGPALAGAVIGWFAHAATQGPAELTGIGLAFIVDALTFAVSVVTLWAMSSNRREQASDEGVWQAIVTGLRYAWNDPLMRVMFVVLSLANLFFSGVLLVGIPVLANARLPEGATAFGLIMSAYAGGNLGGIVVTGSLPRPSARLLRTLLGGLLLVFSLALVAFGWVDTTWMAFAILLLLGLGNGYFLITLITLLQRITPKDMLGRMMSLMMLASAGLMPISQAAAGALSKWSLTGLFVVSGALMALLAVWTVVQPALLKIGELQTPSGPQPG